MDSTDGASLPVTEHPLAALATAYADAGMEPSELDYYSTEGWFRNLAANCLQPSERTMVLRAADVVLPLRLRPSRFGPLRGWTARGLSNFYSCRFTPPGLEGGGDSVRAVMALGLALRQRGFATIRFDALDDAPKNALAAGLRRAGWVVEPFEQFGNWYLDTRDLDFDTYWRARPGALRNTGNRRYRALVDRGGACVTCFAAPAVAEAAIAAYESVYTRSWQPAEPFPGYMPGLIRDGLAAGEAQVWVLTAGDQPVAAQVWVRRHNRATIFKLAYDQDWAKHSAGTVLTMAAMRQALSDPSIEEIDFGWGDDPYKQEWLPLRRQRYGIAAYNLRSAIGLAQAVRNLGPRKLRALFGGTKKI
tara:strand:- start:1193 stop:2275 length:1083 start_codon:yes stop_codon:yes gene_type:complete